MAIWLWYRRGSFALKERFDCEKAAAARAEMLRSEVGRIDIIEDKKLNEVQASQIAGAIEVDAISQRLLP